MSIYQSQSSSSIPLERKQSESLQFLSKSHPQQQQQRQQQNVSSRLADRNQQTQALFTGLNLDQIIQVILTDQKLFQFIMKLVTTHITHEQQKQHHIHSPPHHHQHHRHRHHHSLPRQQLTEIVDYSIEEALDQIRLIDMIMNLLKNPPPVPPPSSSSASHPPCSEDQLMTEERKERSKEGRKENESKNQSDPRYNYSNKIFISLDPDTDNRQNQQLQKLRLDTAAEGEQEFPIKPPSFSEKEPVPPGSHQSVKRTVQALNKHQKPPLGYHATYPASATKYPPTHHSHSHLQDYPEATIANSLFISTDLRQDFSVGGSDRNSFLSVDSVRDSEASTVQIILPLEKSLTDKLPTGNIPPRVFDDSFEEKENLFENSKLTDSPDGNNGTSSPSPQLINQSFQVTSEINSVQNSMEIPSLSRGKNELEGKVLNIPTEQSKQAKGRTLLIEKEEEEEDVDVNETVKDWGKKVKLQEEHNQNDEDFHQISKQFDRHHQKETTDHDRHNHDISGDSNRYDEDNFEADGDELKENQHHQNQKKSESLSDSFPSVQDYLAANYGKNNSNIMCFDQAQFDADVDIAMTGKARKKVHFVDGIVDNLIYYERASSQDAREMFYSHEEIGRFDLHYRKEDSIAEKMGLTWMEWKNQQPDDVEISFSDDDDNDNDHDNNNNNHNNGEGDGSDDDHYANDDDYNDYPEEF